jgi:hypothetical protein
MGRVGTESGPASAAITCHMNQHLGWLPCPCQWNTASENLPAARRLTPSKIRALARPRLPGVGRRTDKIAAFSGASSHRAAPVLMPALDDILIAEIHAVSGRLELFANNVLKAVKLLELFIQAPDAPRPRTTTPASDLKYTCHIWPVVTAFLRVWSPNLQCRLIRAPCRLVAVCHAAGLPAKTPLFINLRRLEIVSPHSGERVGYGLQRRWLQP